MSILSMIGISTAYAAPAANASSAGSLLSMLPMLIGFGLIFYFMFIRPQNKRASEHRTLIGNLGKGDEVLTTGGIIGRVSKINDDFLLLSVAEQVDITVKKTAVANVLPKGTLKSV